MTQLGVRLRVLIPSDTVDAPERYRECAGRGWHRGEGATTRATLEDVFVAVTLTAQERSAVKSLSRIMAIVKKEVRQLRRDRLTFGMVVGLPVIQMLLFGYAINTDVRNLKTAVADQAETHLSRQFIAGLAADAGRRYRGARRQRRPNWRTCLRRGEISIGVLVPADFDRRVVDRSRIRRAVTRRRSRPDHPRRSQQLRACPWRLTPPPGPANRRDIVEVRPYYNPERRTPVNIIPGLIGVILTMTMILFTAVAIVRERERGNLELLINTPVSSAELMIGKVIPYIVIGMLQLALILAVGRLLFDVPVRGSILDLYLWRQRFRGRQPGAGFADFDGGQDAVSGHADDGIHPAAVDPVVGLHVSVRRHAGSSPNTSARRCRIPTLSA